MTDEVSRVCWGVTLGGNNEDAWVLMMALATGCSSKDSESVEDGGPAGTDDSGETMGDDTASPEDEALLNGLYSSGFLVGPVSGLVVGLQPSSR